MSKKSAILSAGLVALLCVAVIIGSTFALFGVSRSDSISVSTGSVNISAAVSDLSTTSLSPSSDAAANTPAENFATGGTAALNTTNGTLTLTNIVPGDSATFTLTITNTGNNAAKIRVNVEATLTTADASVDVLYNGEEDSDANGNNLLVTVKNGADNFAINTWDCGSEANGADGEGDKALILGTTDNKTLTLTITVSLDKNAVQPISDGVVGQLITEASIKITVYAGQANASDSDLDSALNTQD